MDLPAEPVAVLCLPPYASLGFQKQGRASGACVYKLEFKHPRPFISCTAWLPNCVFGNLQINCVGIVLILQHWVSNSCPLLFITYGMLA